MTNAIAIGSDAVVSNSNRMVLGQSGTDIQFDGALLPANNAGTSGQILTSSGPGAAPTWTTVAGATSTLQGAYDGGNTNWYDYQSRFINRDLDILPFIYLRRIFWARWYWHSFSHRQTNCHAWWHRNGEALELRGDGTGANTLHYFYGTRPTPALQALPPHHH